MVKINFVNDCIYEGKVCHKRLEPFKHEFSYSLSYFWLDIKKCKKLIFFKHNKLSLFSFFDLDHGEINRDKNISLFDYLRGELKNKKIGNIDSIKVLCLPRILNYQFNPISVFVAYDFKRKAKAIIFQVSNTFGERHSYFSKVDKEKYLSKKVFHVSPFFGIEGSYEIKFEIIETNIKLLVIYKDKNKKFFIADFSGVSSKLNDFSLIKIIALKSLQNIKVTLAIHYQSLKLWFKGAIYYKKPEKPKNFLTKLK